MANIYDEQRRQVEEIMSNASPKSGFLILPLTLFGGLMGLHRFYVGKIGSGILYMFTCGGFFIGMVLDVIKICTGKFTDSKGRVVFLNPQASYDNAHAMIDIEELKAQKRMMELENEDE